MHIINLRQRTPEWLAWRAQGITASEAPVILGRSPYKTPWQLWAERSGVTTAEDLSGKPCVQRGIKLEDHVRRGFEKRHQTLLLPVCAEADAHPVLRCSLDGLTDTGEPVELKVPTFKTYEQLGAQGEQTAAYQLAWCQLQFQLSVTGAKQGWLVFDPCRASSPALEFCVSRDDGFISQELVPGCLNFWAAIQTGKAPPQDLEQDVYVPVDGELTEWRQAAQTYRDLMGRRQGLEQQLKGLKDPLAQAEAVFVRLMGDWRLAEAEGVRVTRFQQQGTVDYQALLVEIAPDLDAATLEQYRKPPSARVKVTLHAPPEPVIPPKPTHPAATSFYF